MSRTLIQKVFDYSYKELESSRYLSQAQKKAATAIINCKSPRMGLNMSICEECGSVQSHYNSCRDRNCPNCQAIKKELWIDARQAEVMDAPYFHVVFTIPSELNALMYCNQKLLYDLFHKCAGQTLAEHAIDKKYLGATPEIIQVLHTWGQELNYHPHIHTIVSGGGLTKDMKLKKSPKNFFVPIHVLREKFKGKFLDNLKSLKASGELSFSSSIASLERPEEWQSFINSLYEKDWCPYIKETFNGFGNAIEYLGRYTHRIAITNARIVSVSEDEVSFRARDYRTGTMHVTTLKNTEFIRRFLMHVLPTGFQKIRYYGLLNNRCKAKNLSIVFKQQGYQKFKAKYQNMSVAEIMKSIWKIDICTCPECGCANSLRPLGTHYPLRC